MHTYVYFRSFKFLCTFRDGIIASVQILDLHHCVRCQKFTRLVSNTIKKTYCYSDLKYLKARILGSEDFAQSKGNPDLDQESIRKIL